MRRVSGLVRGICATVVLALVATTAGAGPLYPGLSGGPAHQAQAAPGQRWGSAAGQEHLKRPDHVNKTLPQSQRGRYPTVHGRGEPQNVASVEQAPVTRTGFDKSTSREVPEARDANKRVYTNHDGTETTEFSPDQINYPVGKDKWAPIDTSLTADAQGWRNDTNSAKLRFAPTADSPELAVLRVGEQQVAYGLAGAKAVPGKAAGSSVGYPDVLPGVDLRYDAKPGGIKETLLLTKSDAPAKFVFPLKLTGLKPAIADGQLVLTDAQGTVKAVVPPGDMIDAAQSLSRGVAYRLVDGPALEVTLDEKWLRDPARKFPVAVDPTVKLPVQQGNADAESGMYVKGSTSASGSSHLLAGKVDGQSTASYLKFAGLVDQLRFHTIFGVQLQLANEDSNSCSERAVTVHGVTQSWSPTGSYSYPGPTVGGALATETFAHGHLDFGQPVSKCPAAAEVFDLGGGGVKLVQDWVDGTAPNNGLSIRANVSDPLSGKSFVGTGVTANAPRLYVTHSAFNADYAIASPTPSPPVLQNQDGKIKITVTNRSAAAWDPASYALAYRIYKNDASQAQVGQQRSASLPATVARGGKVTLDATIKRLPPGNYFLDFSMVYKSTTFFTDQQVRPARLVLSVVDIPPVIQELYPPNGYQTQTLMPLLWGRGIDIDSPPGATLSYKFEVCERNEAGGSVNCFDSGYQKSPAWTVPDGKLYWAKNYLWRVFVKDGTTEVPSDQSALIADVPQPELTSKIAGAAQATEDREFDALSGNYSTVAVDATATTIGPELNIVRTYNSLDPRRDGAFGAGWTTRYDMRLVPDDDGSGNVLVTYADGQVVRFGRNPDGGYATANGRTAVLTQANGIWKLVDRSGVAYQFSASGLLTKITDIAQRSVNLTYSITDGKLSKAQVSNSQTNTAGRSMRFTWSGTHISSVTTDLNTTWNYTYSGDLLTTVCAPGNACTKYNYGPGSHYRSAVLDSKPESYWRLDEAQNGTEAGSEVEINLGKDAGKYTSVALGTPGAIAGGSFTAGTFNGSTSRLDLPKGLLKKSRDGAVELWFKANQTGTGGPLIGYQDKAFGTTPGRGVPVLYVGTDGKLRGQFGNTTIAPITSPGSVQDGRWHHAVLSGMGTTQTLYLDGVKVGQANGVTIDHALLTFNQVGAASISTPASWPAWGTAAQRVFNGSIDEVAVYSHPLGAASVSAHFRYGANAADQLTTVTLPTGSVASAVTYDVNRNRVATYTDRDGGLWKVGPPAVYGGDTDLRRSIQVLDPGNRPILYEYDGLSGQLLRSGTPLGLEIRDEDLPQEPPPPPPVQECNQPDPGDPQFCTIIPGDAGGPVFVRHPVNGMAIRTYQYDDRGNMTKVTNENGDSVEMTHDSRGNVISSKTCQNSTTCQTTYTTYPATITNPGDPRNELPTETRDGRSASATDPNYRTSYTYTAYGDIATQTLPDGNFIKHTYTAGNEAAVGGGTMPPGLVLTTTDTRGKVTRYAYYTNGDLGKLTSPSGLVTNYTYDVLGRVATETEVSDTFPSGVTTTYEYDALSRLVKLTEPATTDAVNGTRHQQQTVTTYDADGNVTKVDDADLLGGDPTRTTSTEYDEHGRPIRVTDPEGNDTTTNYDRFGNVMSTTDPNGNRYDYAYTARNALAEVRLRNYNSDDKGGLTRDYLVLRSYSYDLAGRKASETDAMGRRTEYVYNGDDKIRQVVLKKFNGTEQDYVIEQNTYDGAGNQVKQVAGNGSMTVTQTFDKVGNLVSTVEDPGGLARTTTNTYDAAGNVTRTSRTGKASNVPWPTSMTPEVVDYAYDDAGNAIRETVTVGTTTQTTTSRYDQRGQMISTTDPRGNVPGADPAAYTTNFSYDELGRQISESGAPIQAESNGGAPQTVRPTSKNGYNTFDETVAAQDEAGNVTRTSYDRLGRPTVEEGTPYKAPGASAPITPTTRTRYDGVGNVLEETDPRGNSVRYSYDQLNRMVTKDQPTTTNDTRAVSRYTYTRTDQPLSTTDALGGRIELTYDDLDRPITSTQVERRPVNDNFTTRMTYDDAGRVTQQQSPSGAISKNTYDALGQLTAATDAAGVQVQYGYDFSGRMVRQSDAFGRTSQSTYDEAGRLIAATDIKPGSTGSRVQRRTYDVSGNVLTATDALGATTKYEYDADDRLVKQIEPVNAGTSITSTFGYDAMGRRTRFTNGLGNSTLYTYNTLGLTESLIEPATQAFPNAADRTWTASYDANGMPVKMASPGGVVTNVTFDAAGRAVKQTGSGASVATPDQIRAYDALGRMTEVDAPTGKNTFAYNDRGQLLTSRGPAGDADFEYDADGNMTLRTDASGTSRFGYTNGRLSSVVDGITSIAQRIGYDPAGQLSTIDYGSGRVRTYGYDDYGRNTSDTLRNNGGATVFSIGYSYDDDDQLIGKTTGGTAGAGNNTYGYDQSGRLTSWTGPNGTVDYGWDAAGNRTRAGPKTATYDARNQLLSDGDYTYTYTARGTMASRTSSGLAEPFEFDAYDRMTKAIGQNYTYDGLNRLVARGSTAFRYAGLSDEPVSDGTDRYARGAGDDLLAFASGSGSALALSDGHDDVVGGFAPNDAVLSGLPESAAYDPFGQVIASQGDTGNLGFQGDWTDPDTKQVNMGARWYNPSTGTFDSRDSANYAGGDSILANRFTYGGGDPLGATDPDGNWPCWSCAVNKVKSVASSVAHSVVNFVRSAPVREAFDFVKRSFTAVTKSVVSFAKKAYHAVKKTVSSGLSMVGKAAAKVGKWAARQYRETREDISRGIARAKQIAQATARKIAKAKEYARKQGITKLAKAAVATAMKHTPLKVLAPVLKPLVSVTKMIISTAPKIAAAKVAAFRDSVNDTVKQAQALYEQAKQVAGTVVSNISAAADAVADFAQAAAPYVKMAAKIAADMSGATDAINCVTKGDLEACAWTAATIAGYALGGAGGGAVRAARAARLAAKAGDKAVDAVKTGKRLMKAGSCATGNSFTGDTQVRMADGSSKPIGQVRIGEKVLATDPTTGRTEAEPVTDVIVGSGEKDLVDVTVDSGRITATDGHQFWVGSENRWVQAGDLTPGSRFETSGDRVATVAATRKYRQWQQVYNLTVDTIHTFYVLADESPVLVHNCDIVVNKMVGDQFRDHVADFFRSQGRHVVTDADDWEALTFRGLGPDGTGIRTLDMAVYESKGGKLLGYVETKVGKSKSAQQDLYDTELRDQGVIIDKVFGPKKCHCVPRPPKRK